MIRKTDLRKKAGKFFAVLASAAMVVTSIPMNYGYAKADSVQTVSEDDDSKTPTVEKNASDVAVLCLHYSSSSRWRNGLLTL